MVTAVWPSGIAAKVAANATRSPARALSGVGFSMKVPKTRVTKPASVGHGRDRLEVYLTPRRSLTMSCHPRVTEWATTLQTYLPHLSKPQIRVLALWRLGMVLARAVA